MEIYLKLYGRNLERIGVFRLLGVWFDTQMTWTEHINRVVVKGKKKY